MTLILMAAGAATWVSAYLGWHGVGALARRERGGSVLAQQRARRHEER